jgi:curved DNA-binding protein
MRRDATDAPALGRIREVLTRPKWREWYTQVHCGTSYYAVLGVRKTCTTDDIRRAYKALARELHPDRRNNAITRNNVHLTAQAVMDMQRVNAAHAVLTQSRALYDTARAPYDFNPGAPQAPESDGSADDGSADDGYDDPADGDPARGPSPRSSKRRKTQKAPAPDPGPQKVVLVVPLSDLYGGTKRTVELARGYELEDGTWVTRVVPFTIRIPERTMPGHFATRSAAGEYHPGRRGCADIWFIAELPGEAAPFTVAGSNLHTRATVDLVSAVTGHGEYRVLHPTDFTLIRRVKLSRRLKHGETVTVRGLGLRDLATDRLGDLICTVDVRYPEMRGPRVAKAFRACLAALFSDNLFESEAMTTAVLHDGPGADATLF